MSGIICSVWSEWKWNIYTGAAHGESFGFVQPPPGRFSAVYTVVSGFFCVCFSLHSSDLNWCQYAIKLQTSASVCAWWTARWAGRRPRAPKTERKRAELHTGAEGLTICTARETEGKLTAVCISATLISGLSERWAGNLQDGREQRAGGRSDGCGQLTWPGCSRDGGQHHPPLSQHHTGDDGPGSMQNKLEVQYSSGTSGETSAPLPAAPD